MIKIYESNDGDRNKPVFVNGLCSRSWEAYNALVASEAMT